MLTGFKKWVAQKKETKLRELGTRERRNTAYLYNKKQGQETKEKMKKSLYRFQRPYRKDRLPRAYFCCRQRAKFRIVRGICLYNMLHWLVCYKPAGQSFPDFGVWVSVDFDSKYKILCRETRDHGVPIQERKKKSKQEST